MSAPDVRARTRETRGITGLRSVNDSLSKPFEFSENSRAHSHRMCAKTRTGSSSLPVIDVPCGEVRTAAGLRTNGTGSCSFLLRMAFWLTLVLALLPTGSSQPQAHASAPQIDAADAVVAAGAAVSDMSGFCDRQPEACKVGAQAAVVIGQRAQAGASMVYDFIQERMARSETGSVQRGQGRAGVDDAASAVASGLAVDAQACRPRTRPGRAPCRARKPCRCRGRAPNSPFKVVLAAIFLRRPRSASLYIGSRSTAFAPSRADP